MSEQVRVPARHATITRQFQPEFHLWIEGDNEKILDSLSQRDYECFLDSRMALDENDADSPVTGYVLVKNLTHLRQLLLALPETCFTRYGHGTYLWVTAGDQMRGFGVSLHEDEIKATWELDDMMWNQRSVDAFKQIAQIAISMSGRAPEPEGG